jgi:uncharacterized protein (DUF362 family)
MTPEVPENNGKKMKRRNFLKAAAVCIGAGTAAGLVARQVIKTARDKNATFIARVKNYNDGLRRHILEGFKELGITQQQIQGKSILLKPNLVEPHLGLGHINTHPLVVHAAIESFLHLGAKSIAVAEGSGHIRDIYQLLEEAEFLDILSADKVPFVDLNTAEVTTVKNRSRYTKLKEFVVPKIILEKDIIVSMAKMKTHHWAGATLAMKNMFGILPGLYYGWPKNVLHFAGIHESIADINTAIRADLAIVDGVVGMEGDGPIMGEPVESNVMVMGRNLAAVDATCARVMGLNPQKIKYMKLAEGKLGEINENLIEQRGEAVASVRKDFKLLDTIPAQARIRL